MYSLSHTVGSRYIHILAGHSEGTKYSAFGFRLDSELMDDNKDGENESDVGESETESEGEE